MVVHAYYKDDTRVRREAEALIEHGKQVDIVCLRKDDEPLTETFKGATIHRCNIGRSKERTKVKYILEYLTFAFLAMLKVTRLFFSRKPKIVVTHNMPNFLVFASLIPRLFGAKIVLDMHDVMPELYTNLFNIRGGSLLQKALYIEEKISARFCHELITVNAYIEELLSTRIGKPFHIVYNTPDPNALQVTERRNHEEAEFLLFHHGNIQKRYGLERVIPVLKQLNEESGDYKLEVHGLGPYYDDIKAQVKEADLEQHASLNGRFTPESIGEHIARADVGLVPNYADEFADILLPVKLLEYVACRVPVITARMKAVEQCFDESMVYYFDTEEDMANLIKHIRNNPQEAAERADKAWHQLQEIAWDRQKIHYVKLMEALANK